MQVNLGNFGQTPFFWERVYAFLVDNAIVGILCMFPKIGWIFGLMYFLLKDALPFTNGVSYGRQFFKIKVVKQLNGESLVGSADKSVLRNLVWLIPVVNLYEVYRVLFTASRLGDSWSGSVVVSAVDPS